MRFNILLFLSLALAFASCETEEITEVVTFTETTLSGETVTANFFGQLTNDQGVVVQGAEVRIGNKQATTDQEGLWSINNASVVKDQAFIQFAADRHHKGSRTLLVEGSNTYEVDVEMLQYTGTLSVDATSGGTVNITGSDASVTFPGSAFAKTDGTPYTGTVRVEAAYLDPNDLSTGDRMPGDLRATTTSGDSRLLITYGMVSVELFDNVGNELQLAAGQTATISLPVAGDAANTAPQTIPLWYFDDASAQWLEEGSATLQNGSYVGEVSHFTFWNCDIPTDYIRLCGTVVFEGTDTTTAANLTLIIESLLWGSGYGYTDENGQFCGIVPANETLTFTVRGACNQPTFTVTIGPFSADTDLGTITVPSPQNLLTTVSGTANCNGTPLTSGAVRIFQNGSHITTTTVQPNGSFTTDFLSCDTSEITVSVVNYATLEEGTETFAYSNNIATGDIGACVQTLSNYFELIVDGVTETGFDSIYYNNDGSYTFTSGFVYSGGQTSGFSLTTEDLPSPPALGTYTVSPEPNGQRGLYVYSGQVSTGFLSIQSDYDVAISELPTTASPFVRGQIGPFTETATDSFGVTVTHNIQINFSAPYF
ncbi:MAG: hypothetical protein AB8F78_03190 [Saprospiraceae bacterium]